MSLCGQQTLLINGFDRRHILVTESVGILIEQSLAQNKSAIVDASMVEG